MPGGAHGAGEHVVGLVVVEELFLVGVPLERAVEAHGDVAAVAGGVGPDGLVGGADGGFGGR